jgi:hypothetical protein
MITTAAKWFFGLALVSFVLAIVYGYSTGGTRLGPFTLGYYGGIGDHLGYTVLVTLTLAGLLFGLIAVVTRDADPAALAQIAGTEDAPAAVAPAYPSYWPLLGAFGVTLVALGLVISNVMFVVGAFLLIAVLVEWMVLAWSDHATGDPETNRLVRRRMMAPFEVPLAGFIVAAGSVIAISRVLLTASEVGAVGVACAVGLVVLGVGVLLAMRPNMSSNVVAGVLTTLGIAVVVIGVASAARGERFIEEHPAEHKAEEAEHNAEGDEPTGNTPLTPAGTKAVTTTTTEGEGR